MKIKRAKETHYKTAFQEHENNTKKTWGMINELTSRKQNNCHVKEVSLNDTLLHNPEKLNEAFNNHFIPL